MRRDRVFQNDNIVKCVIFKIRYYTRRIEVPKLSFENNNTLFIFDELVCTILYYYYYTLFLFFFLHF